MIHMYLQNIYSRIPSKSVIDVFSNKCWPTVPSLVICHISLNQKGAKPNTFDILLCLIEYKKVIYVTFSLLKSKQNKLE